MRHCVSVLLGVSAVVLCISGVPLKLHSEKAIDHVADKMTTSDSIMPVESAENVKSIKEVTKDAEKNGEETEPVERDYNPSYGAPSYGTPYGYPNSYGAPPSNYNPSNSYNGGQNSLTNPAFHQSKATAAAQNIYTQGNAAAYGEIAADSYAPYYSGGRRRRDALSTALDNLTKKLKNIVNANDIKEALEDKAANTVDERDDSANDKTGEKIERGYAPAYGYGYTPYNPYKPYPVNYGYQQPFRPLDSALVSQAASATNSVYLTGGASSTRPEYPQLTYYQPYPAAGYPNPYAYTTLPPQLSTE